MLFLFFSHPFSRFRITNLIFKKHPLNYSDLLYKPLQRISNFIFTLLVQKEQKTKCLSEYIFEQVWSLKGPFEQVWFPKSNFQQLRSSVICCRKAPFYWPKFDLDFFHKFSLHKRILHFCWCRYRWFRTQIMFTMVLIGVCKFRFWTSKISVWNGFVKLDFCLLQKLDFCTKSAHLS